MVLGHLVGEMVKTKVITETITTDQEEMVKMEVTTTETITTDQEEMVKMEVTTTETTTTDQEEMVSIGLVLHDKTEGYQGTKYQERV